MTDDIELLRRFSEEGSESAFAELVRRRIDFVYGVALRQTCGDAHLAEDVVQGTFTALARKAKSLSSRATIMGWLYRTAQYLAIDQVRSEARRRRREEEAQAMEHSTDPQPDWDRLRPLLDRAMSSLEEADRDALMLRFFEQRAFAEVGLSLRTSEDAARLRVVRALEKVRTRLAKQGITSTAAMLSTAIAHAGVATAPTHLAATVTGTAIAAAAQASAASYLTFLSMTKFQTGSITALVVAGLVGVGLQHQTNAELHRGLALLRQDEIEAAQLRTENGRLREQAVIASRAAAMDDLARLRAEAAGLEVRLTQHRANSPVMAERSEEAVRGMVPVESWIRAGFDTPGKAFETVLWAKEQFDIAALAGSLAMEPAVRAEAELLLEKLPPDVRRQFPDVTSAESMLALAWALGKPAVAMRVMSATEVDPDTVKMRGLLLQNDGTTARVDVDFYRDGNGWRWSIPPFYARQLLQKIAQTTGAR